MNDTTGTLVKGVYDDHECAIGLILGTGCNGAYLEKAQNVAHWEGDRHGAKEVIVDPEFGAFGDNGCIDFVKTEFDKELDKISLLPGQSGHGSLECKESRYLYTDSLGNA